MQISILSLAWVFALSGPTAPIQADEITELSQSFQRWWESELVWQLDELPTSGAVPEFRIPYSGHDYPDQSGGTYVAMRKYDLAFHRGRGLASAFEQKDTTSSKELTERTVRAGLFGRRRRTISSLETPGWHGHCNGWAAASMRHAEPQRSVVRKGVVFSPADIKGLLADVYMYSQTEFLGGLDYAINPGTLHVMMANWLGRGKHPVAMETSLGPVVFNYPNYSYETTIHERSSRQAEVWMHVTYATSINRELNQSPRNHRVMDFHYLLELDETRRITGGRYYSDSTQIDMLWVPRRPIQGGLEGNKRGNPHLDVNEVMSIWRESVPAELRNKWFNIDPLPEDRIDETEAPP